MMSTIPFISNQLNIDDTKSICAILGESPSKGARSPLLWNKCFEEFKIPCHFYPFDIDQENLYKLIEFLKGNENFLGGAIAVPHKEILLNLLDEVEEEAKLIGAINVIYKNKMGLCGANTDGLGAVASIANMMDLSIEKFAKSKNAIIIGTGGAAKAVAVYMSKAVGEKGNVFIVGNSDEKINLLVQKCKNFSNVEGGYLNHMPSLLHTTNFLINASAIGYENIYSSNGNFLLEPFLPVGSSPKKGFISDGRQAKIDWLFSNLDIMGSNYLESLKVFEGLNKNALVMDIVYQPKMTMFLRMAKLLGFNTLSGIEMNLLQAVYGFDKTIRNDYSINQIKETMSLVD